jgi:hypothetical protein
MESLDTWVESIWYDSKSRAIKSTSLPIRMIHLEEACLRSSTAGLVCTYRYGRQCRLTFALICRGSVQNYSGTQPLDTRTIHVGSDRDAAFASANLRVPTGSS